MTLVTINFIAELMYRNCGMTCNPIEAKSYLVHSQHSVIINILNNILLF